MINTCKTCEWWDAHSYKSEGECNLIDTVNDFRVEASVMDDSGLYVRLITGSDFGCVKHKAK